MKFGLKEDDYNFIKNQLVAILGSKINVWCFGSRARGDYKQFSDIDLMLDSDLDLSLEVSKLREIFEESSLAIKVDLIQEKDFSSSYFKNYKIERIAFY
jgi:predicted nucleotidyltransferase